MVVLVGLGGIGRQHLVAQASNGSIADRYREVANQIIDAALADSAAYTRLTEMVDLFGHRFSGSESLEHALDWILEGMRSDGLDNVRGVEVIDRILANEDRDENFNLLSELCDTMIDGSLCAMGGMTPFPVRSAVKYFPEDFKR